MASQRKQVRQVTEQFQLRDTISGKYLVMGPSGWCYLGDRAHAPWVASDIIEGNVAFKIVTGNFRKRYIGVSMTGAVGVYDPKNKGHFQLCEEKLVCKRGKYKGHMLSAKKDDFVYCWNSYRGIKIQKVTKTKKEMDEEKQLKVSQMDDGTSYLSARRFVERYARKEVFRTCGEIRDFQFEAQTSLLDYLVGITFTDKEKNVEIAEQKAVEFCNAHPEYGLTKHEAGMISLYTAENRARGNNFYAQLDSAVRERTTLVPWLDAIWLIDQGLHKLPAEKVTGFRVVNFVVDKIDDVAEGHILVWTQFSGISAKEVELSSLPKPRSKRREVRVIEITTISGRNIKELCLYPRGNVCVLPLGSEFKVTSVTGDKTGTKAVMVQQESERLFSCSLTEENIKDFVGDVMANKWDLSRKAVLNTECSILATVLKSNSTLLTLTLGKNKIEDVGMSVLASALKENSTLTTLSLWGNVIGDVGAAAIGESLMVNLGMTSVYLHENNIGDNGAVAIAEGLKKNLTLTKLWLMTNQIGNVGAAAIAEGLEINSVIQLLWLSQNNIGEEAKAEIRTVKSVHPSLKHLAM